MTIYISNINPYVDEIELRKIFGLYGEITSIKITINQYTGIAKGFGFIEMKNETDALNAIKGLDGISLKDQILRVSRCIVKKNN